MKEAESWFMNQHYNKEELEQLDKWNEAAGRNVIVKEINNKWSGFHILDTDFKIDIAGQSSEEDCKNWMDRLNYKYE